MLYNKILLLLSALTVASACTDGSLSPDDPNAPVGFATCADIHGGRYDLTGGARDAARGVRGRMVKLLSDGLDSRPRIEQALRDYDIVVLDGSAGPFIYSESSVFTDLRDKTIAGVNGAVIRTAFQLTDELKAAIAEAEVRYSDAVPDSTGKYILPDGKPARNKAGYIQMRAIMDATGDTQRRFMHSGVFAFSSGCSNIILRNIYFDGPGSFRGKPDSMIRIMDGCHHVWIDHCTLEDFGCVGLGVVRGADCVTVSWCELRITGQSATGHTLGCLVAGSDDHWQDEDLLNVTFDHCKWTDVWSRLPMARFGTIHVNNSLYDCPGTVGINPRQNSEFLVEGCWFEPGSKPLCLYRVEDFPPKAYVFRDNVYDPSLGEAGCKGEVTVPYEYVSTSPQRAREQVIAHAGPTLRNPLKTGR